MIILSALAEQAVSEAMVLEALLARIANGDKAALGELYDRTHSAIYGFAMSLSHCTHDAEDVLQETYIQVFGAAESYKPQGKPMAWLMTIAKNLAKMKLRDYKRMGEMPDEDWSDYLAANPAVTSDERILLNAALRELTGEQSQIIMLHAVSGLKHREIARLLDMPVSTVLSKYSRAIKKLQQIMGGE